MAVRKGTSFAYASAHKRVKGNWDSLRFIERDEGQSLVSFADVWKPGSMKAEYGDGLVLHQGEGSWEAPSMPAYLLSMMKTGAVGVKPKVNQDLTTKISREGVAGADGLNILYRRKMKEVGLPQGVFTWYCPLPKSGGGEAEVDVAWMKLAEAYEGGKFDPFIESIIVRGPLPLNMLRPLFNEGRRTSREDYRFHIITKDFDDREAINKVHWAIRSLDCTSNKGLWIDYVPLYEHYLGWGCDRPLYSCPPTGGDVIHEKERHTWGATNPRDNRLPQRLGEQGRQAHSHINLP